MAHLRAAAVVSSESSIRFHAARPGATHALVRGFAIVVAGMCRGVIVNIDHFTQHLEHPPG